MSFFCKKTYLNYLIFKVFLNIAYVIYYEAGLPFIVLYFIPKS